MATKVHMEALSPTMEEGQIVKWHKAEGDSVSNGEILAEIETDKATMELVARGEGTLRKILVPEGGNAPVGDVIAVIAGDDEDISELTGDGEAAPDEGADEKAANEKDADERDADEDEKEADEDADEDADEAEEPAEKPAKKDKSKAKDDGEEKREDSDDDEGADPDEDAAAEPDADRRIRASPVARRLADEEGLRLADIDGSGPGGRIVKRDVERAAKEGPPAAAAAAAPAFLPDSEEEYEDIPLSQMRKTIAKRLVQSIGPVPHFFLTVDVDMTRAVEARKRVNAMLEDEGVRISFNDIVLKATAMALARHPECNAHWGGDHVRRFNRVHLGVAVAIDDGLITPVVRDAHLKGLKQIAAEVREMAGRAREKKLKPDEYMGATFSVSNLGMFGIDEFTAVINPPEAGILAVGGMVERPVIVDGELDVQTRMKITMSCDHRVIDGAQGSRFLQTLTTILEEPLAALV
jgi:pyruvate dehydrogenase E2 component (dihydrolipoamide acetyltransferase)